ncbi:reverse transcriptase family protein [Sphingomonas sp. RS6]
MIGASPHQYRAEAAARGRPEPVISAAIAQAAKAEAMGAPAILTLGHLAFRMDVSHRYLRSVIAKRTGEFYREFHIRKRSGGLRRVVVPAPKLMSVQRWIAREILRDRPVHDACFAYVPRRSIVDCATRHVGAGWLLKLDIHDFFESIPERSVYHVFRSLGYQPLVSFELTRICTRPWIDPPVDKQRQRSVANWARRGIELYRRRFTGYLPQGAPTSPMLSNLVCRSLDEDLSAFASREGLVFTRYSDDLTFSGPTSSFSRDRAKLLTAEVRSILVRHRFRMHEGKISVVPPGARKVVLGLLVDRDRPRLSRELRTRLEDHVRGLERFGIAAHADNRGFASTTGMINHIAGLIRFARDVEANFADALRVRLEAALMKWNWTPLS